MHSSDKTHKLEGELSIFTYWINLHVNRRQVRKISTLTEHGNVSPTLESLSLTSSWLCVLACVKPIGCLEIVLALCGDCKLRKSSTIFHFHPSFPSVFHSMVDFFLSLFHPRWKKRSRATSLSRWLYCVDLCKSTSECMQTDCWTSSVYVPVVGCNVIILALQGLNVWKFVSCH